MAEENIQEQPVDAGVQVDQPTEEAQESFFSYKSPDGTVNEYKSPEDLQKAFKESYFRQSDYTQKTQEIAKQKKEMEEQLAKFKQEQEEFGKVRGQYDKFNNFIKTRPNTYKKWMKEIETPAGANDIQGMVDKLFDEKYGGRLKKLEELEEQRNREIQRKQIFEELQKEYEDFSPDVVSERFNKLADSDAKELFRLIHLAYKGEENPFKTEMRMAQNLEKKKNASLLHNGVEAKTKKPGFDSDEQARMAAMKDAGIWEE